MAYKFCPECGYKLDGEYKFCPECGYKLAETVVSKTALYSAQDFERAKKEFDGAHPDLSKIPLFKQFAEAGDAEAMLLLALCYYAAESHDDVDKADYWVKKSAESGNSDAQYQLGLLYDMDGDYEKAMYWYKKAGDGGSNFAKSEYERLKAQLKK